MDPLEPDAATLTEDGEICRTGRLSALLCTPRGAPLIDARVEVETRRCDGRAVVVEARTDDRGNFVVDGLRAGEAVVRISSGRFTAQYDVEIPPGGVASLSPTGSTKVCLEADAAALAVVGGDYDRIEGVLDGLGFAYDFYCGGGRDHRPARRLLGDPALLDTYDVLFVDCGSGIDLRADNPEVAAMRDALRGFVERGGSLYVSDLSADFVEALWPDAVEFRMQTREAAPAAPCCVCTDDCPAECATTAIVPPGPYCAEPGERVPACGSGVRGGGAVGRVGAQIVDERLAALFGDSALDVLFDLPGWVEIDGVGPETEVLVEAGRPLMVAFPAGAGRVVYTSFHNDEQTSDDIRALLSALVFQL